MPERSELQNSSDAQSLSRLYRFKRLMVENPLVAIGIIFTGAVLINGARTMRASSAASMQKMMRWRIYGQGASLALLAYLSLKVNKNYKRKHPQHSLDD
ncbi:hypothetical protein ECG_05005 [Echinococcus granulosus]|uniref:Phospholipid transporting ATPase VA n=2 Tax=Echinococcus TaxID=6209 RepID=U6JJK6_ECHGR|nr:hypothetical protein EGR_08796 [Echinococcus granulosus]EUB56321.1 hypothetical protein EGR_08796 [Echinococcus granulosus]KAH9282805.1 hypothetical protein ECG_05005 [Echinococcus granulosus]CDS24281.1 phospholipid transporting ATPase VA [Echinococcus granulosus]CDS41465.1 phospholipid transporting ATPase VA [Echinococcus multilocularis]